MRRFLLVAVLTPLLAPLLTGCPRPASPDTDRPPEPQAAQVATRDAVRAPMDPANPGQATVDAAAESRRAAIEAQAN